VADYPDVPYPNAPTWSDWAEQAATWVGDRIETAQTRGYDLAEDVVQTPSNIAHEGAQVAPETAKQFGEGLSTGAIVVGLVVAGGLTLGAVVAVGAGIYFFGPEISAALAVAKTVKKK
jgi:hypothetical protein